MQTGKIFVVVAVLALLGLGAWYGLTKNRAEMSQENAASVINDQNQEDMNSETQGENPTVVLKTNKGDIAIELYIDQATITAGNFLNLARDGFYDGTKFHRVIQGFMIQGGDPNTKTDDEATYGTGGPGYAIQDEFAPNLSNEVGTISMANAGPNTGGSQFFINVADNTFLDGKHAVFGEVVEGMDVVRAIEVVETKERDIPVEPVVVSSVEVRDAE